MKFAGIIAEYDPFHNGHAWQLAQAKALGAERVAVAMSCSLVQRGALPLLPEAVRTRSALTCGADLVFALPAPCACAGAEAFARAGVALLAAAGCDGLVFGAETPDAALLMETAELLDSDSYRAALKAQLAGGARSFAAARQAAAAQLASDERVAALLDKPNNNNLAVEYCRAIRSLAPQMEAYPLPRQGADHGEALHSAHGQFASASALRKLWVQVDLKNAKEMKELYQVRKNTRKYEYGQIKLGFDAVNKKKNFTPVKLGMPSRGWRAAAFCRSV